MRNKKKMYIQSLFNSFAIMDTTKSDSTTENDDLNNEDNEALISRLE